MHQLLERIEVAELEIGSGERFFRADLFHNLNRPSDLGPGDSVIDS